LAQVAAPRKEHDGRLVAQARAVVREELGMGGGDDLTVRACTRRVGGEASRRWIADTVGSSRAADELLKADVTDATLRFDRARGAVLVVVRGYQNDLIHLNVGAAASIDEVAEDQDVADLVVGQTTIHGVHERKAALSRNVAERDGVLEEPEADLGIAVD